MQQFRDEASNDAFRQWMRDNPSGFYVNERGSKDSMLHRVGCWHLGSGEGLNCTTNIKICSNVIRELTGWAKGKGLRLARCSSCEPV